MVEIKKMNWGEEEIYCLKNNSFEAYINPNDGMNLIKLCYRSLLVVSYQEERAQKGDTYGIPILFPTPNRTRNNQFTFEKKQYHAKMHGVVRNAKFQVVKTAVEKDSASITGRLDILEGMKIHEQFPFDCTLLVEIQLSNGGIRYRYEVENNDTKNLPFGFGLHPFFHDVNHEALISISANKRMEKDSDFLPTGEVLEVAQTPYDLSGGKMVESLDLDDVYINQQQEEIAIITWKEFQIVICADSVFSHVVVYTPQKEPFFCIEPQTCSTDAIYLYNNHKIEESGLIVLKPKEQAHGEVFFKIS